MDSTNPIRAAERALRPLAAALAATLAATPMAACTGLSGSVYGEPDAVVTNLSGAFWDNAAYNDPCVIKAGSAFGEPVKVLSQGELYPASFGFAGYSTPSAILNGSVIELYYDVYLQTNGAIAKYEQVALHRAVSDDGLAFSEDAPPLLRASSRDWTAREIRGGSELIEDGYMKMWFSGDNYSTSGGSWSGKMTIGYASWPLD